MTKKINNHNIDSDELLKRVKAGNSEGLDDFEKEAFEGFASLDKPDLAQKLNAELDKKLETKYILKKEERSKFMYYAMAAGLVLVVGLSVMFFNNFTAKEETLAYKPETTEQVQNEVNKSLENEVSKESGVNSAEAVEAEPKKDLSANQSPAPPPAEKVLTDGIRDADAKPSDNEDQRKNSEPSPRMVMKGPDTKSPASPVVTEEQKQASGEGFAVGGKDGSPMAGVVADKETKKGEVKERNEKAADDMNNDAKLAQSSTSPSKKQDESKLKKSVNKVPAAENHEDAATSAPAGNAQTVSKDRAEVTTNNPVRAKEKEKAEKTNLDEMEIAKHDEGAAPKTSAASGVGGGDANATVSLRRSSFFKTAKFPNHLEYIDAEIKKNETLKNNMIAYDKSFRIDITISEKGKVTDAKANLIQNKCNDCKEQLEKILMNMPNWEPAQNNNGTSVKQSFYFNYKY